MVQVSKYKPANADTIYYKLTTTLRWTSVPYRILPHGISGLFTLVIGLFLTLCSITGELSPYGLGPNAIYYQLFGYKYLYYLFVFSALVNTVTGYMMIPAATKIGKPIFRVACGVLVGMIYYSLRFMPDHYVYLNKYSTTISGVSSFVPYYVDVVFGTLITISVLYFFKLSYDLCSTSRSIGISIAFATCCMSTFIFYPIQQMLNVNWINCVCDQYPLQGLAMVSYVYVPSITAFSFLAFLATVYSRKIINEVQLSAIIVSYVASTMVLTILRMELLLPDVSTQRLYIPCVEPTDAHSWQYFFVHTLDLSAMTRKLLKVLCNMQEMPKPIYTEL